MRVARLTPSFSNFGSVIFFSDEPLFLPKIPRPRETILEVGTESKDSITCSGDALNNPPLILVVGSHFNSSSGKPTLKKFIVLITLKKITKLK